jgi:hypothetical protein
MIMAGREILIEQTEQAIAKRRAALEKSEDELARAMLLKGRLVASKDRPVVSAASRALKAAEKAAFDALKAKLQTHGKTLTDLLKDIG